MLRATSIGISVGARSLCRGLDLEVAAGELWAVLGCNGSGKSTLLQVLAGVQSPAAGRLEFEARDIDRYPRRELARGLGLLLQSEPQEYWGTLADYVCLGRFPHAQGAFGGDAAGGDAVTRSLADFDLTALAAQPFATLSGGERQRARLAQLWAQDTRLLLLDEPFSNLDVDLRERLAQEVRAILKEAQTTALFVTHDQMEAFAVGDVIGVMSEGRLHQWGDAYSLYHRPATRFVAEFIGHGVFTHATLRQEGHQVVVQTPLGELTDVAELPLPCALASGECDVLLRADDIVHDDAAPVKAQILRKAFRGSEFLYTLKLQSGESVMAHVPSHHDHAVGEWIGIRAQVDHVVTFPRVAA